jgi:cytochrome c551/c552
MRLVLSLLVLAFALSTAAAAWAADGEQVFSNLKCGVCHKPDKRSTGVSVQEIARTYSDRDKLVTFFKGESKPLIESNKWGMMRGELEHIKTLPDDEKEALAEYMLKFK